MTAKPRVYSITEQEHLNIVFPATKLNLKTKKNVTDANVHFYSFMHIVVNCWLQNIMPKHIIYEIYMNDLTIHTAPNKRSMNACV